jgi:hypothetical protein
VDTSTRPATPCPSCGATRPAGASFCPSCGRPTHPAIRRPNGDANLIDVRLWTAVKAGFGFALGGALFGSFVFAAASVVAFLILRF